ncbi:MAG TPA: 50S ribosomal protein L25 [bacterium]|nr:50S ribosomal protein L25 [bacterium]
MIDNVKLTAELRSGTGKGVARKLRAAGKIPAVAYGKGIETTSLILNTREVIDMIRAGNWNQALITLELPGKSELTAKTFMIRELQRHHHKGTPLSMDLYAIRMDEKVTVQIPIELLNTEEIQKQGGVLDVLLRALEVKCLPSAIPTVIQYDAIGLHLGQSLHVSDLTLPEGVETELDPSTPIATIVVPRGVEEAKPGEAVEAPVAEKKEEKTD